MSNAFALSQYNALFLRGLETTLIILFGCSILAFFFGLFLYYGYYRKNRFGMIFYRALTSFITLTPVNVWFYLCLYLSVAFIRLPGIIVGIFALGTMFGAKIAMILDSNISAIPQREKDVAASMGYSDKMALIKLYIPQTLIFIVDSVSQEMKETVKNSALVGMLSVYDFQLVTEMVQEETGETLITAILSIVVYTLLAFLFSEMIKRIGSRITYGKEKSPEEIQKRIQRGKI